ncbi:peptidoglycan DD-metalloendopeptidase family protein, partial [Pseudactinotalea sp.]|uniref:peptidoglycan DD-metalloendopeptidase family protein n=1 Tax=Pseudactinotalea sp. TaxID=1926260 RepID=UPI003B3A95C7
DDEPAAVDVAGLGVVTSEGWSHPIPGVVTFQGNYGQPRGGYIHAGEDLSAPFGTPIYAAAAGVVTRASCLGYAGRSPCNIIINHGPDEAGRIIETWYVHMYQAGVLVTQGQQVAAGEKIALTGSNGNSTGPHLHFEVHLGGSTTDPTAFMAARGVDLRDPSASAAPPVTADAAGILEFARQQIGKPYLWGAAGPDSYDCSGLTSQAYDHAGLVLPRTSREQYVATDRVSEGELQPGDLVFWSSDGTADGIYHVALYAGGGRIVQAPAPGKTVEEVTLWRDNLFAFGRLP